MRLAIERRLAAETTELIEIVTPRTNAAVITPAENLLSAIALDEAFSLEIAATASARWFLARAGNPAMRQHVEDQLAVAYPQAEIRHLDPAGNPALDPAWRAPHEQVAACVLALRAPGYLPLRTFRDFEVEAVRAAQADPVLGLLGAMDGLGEGWRALSQLFLRPAPDDWCRGYLRLAVEHPLAAERLAARGPSLAGAFAPAGLLVAGVLALQAYQWFSAGDWPPLAMLVGGGAVGIPGLAWAFRRLTRKPIYDMRLVQEKIARVAFSAQIRLAIFAPADAAAAQVQTRLGRLAAAYHQFSLAAGNGLVPRALSRSDLDLSSLGPRSSARAWPVLNARELAGLWHLPQAGADLPLLERTTARRRLPLPGTVVQGCRIGVSQHQSRSVPVSLPDELLRRHLLLVAKTRRGKSSLLLQIARYVMDSASGAADRPALVLVDPHRDLSEAALGLVPTQRRTEVVYLDASEQHRPFGLNLLDTGLGWDRDKAVANTLVIFRRQFDRFWGPRMEDAFRFALLTLYEANEAICAADPGGRRRQYTVLDVPAVFTETAFRRSLLGLVRDPVIKAWWSSYFDSLDRRLQVEITNPVHTKVQRFAGSLASRNLIGQPCSTIDPAGWLRTGAIVIVNTAKGTVGEDTAALIGGTLLNLISMVVGEQANLPPTARRRVTLLVDEFHTMPGADYEGILSELAKYGANLILATQSLGRLTALDREQGRALQATVFANLDGLFTFHTSAEDATYLVRELGEAVDEQDLLELGEYQCYAKLSVGRERLPVFSVRLDPPPPGDPDLRDQLAAASAERFGRHRDAVERDLRSAQARTRLAPLGNLQQAVWSELGGGETFGAAGPGQATIGRPSGPDQPRNYHRPRKRKLPDPLQAAIPGLETVEEVEPPAEPDGGELGIEAEVAAP
jgi:hypothetical protein